MLVYPAVFDEGSKYIRVKFPDIPEAMTQALDYSQAYQMAIEVLGVALEDYDTYPKPSSIQDIQESNPGKSVALVAFDPIEYKKKYHKQSVRKNVTIPEWINDLAQDQGINFSQTLTEALKAKLGV